MTDAPAASLDAPAVTAAQVTPDSYIAPLLNLVTQLTPLWTSLAANSADVKTILTNLDLAWALPWLGKAGFMVGAAMALRWVYTRGIGRGHRWALWLQRMMPWNRVAQNVL